MNLLPKDVHGFADKSYWDEFFSKSSRFEWYGEYLELCGVLHKYIRSNDKLLVVGCGNSKLSADLYDAGFHDNVNIDISDTVIKQMTEKFGTNRPKLKYMKMDVKEMSFPSDEFHVVLDKGTLDALLVDGSADSLSNVSPMFEEVQRVLRLGGRYICVTLLQAHVLDFLLKRAEMNGWMVRIHSLLSASLETDKNTWTLPVFVVICTKMKKLPGMNQILEFSASEGSSPDRKDSTIALQECVLACQQYAYLCHQVTSKKFISEDVAIDLYDASNPHPRYRIFALDNSKKTNLKFAVFIVPQGRETEWLFSAWEGRCQLLETVSCQRLLVVHLSRHHLYHNLDQVKEELSQRVTHFQPRGLTSKDQSPFLSVEGHIGERTVLHQGHSPTTGEYVIEDVVSDGGLRLRRLIFLSNQNVIQSEAKLKVGGKVKGRKGKKTSSENTEPEVDHSYLACDHHKHMIAGLAFLSADQIEKKVNILIIGLGGGGLPSYIQKFLPNIEMDVVEIDPTIVSIACKWFGLAPGKNLNLLVDDGLNYLRSCEKEGKHYDLILFDVNNDDASSGLSVPPPAFVEKDILETTAKILSLNGFFVLNLVCRNQSLKKEIYSRLVSAFKTVWFQKVAGELNEIMYASDCQQSLFKENVQKLNNKLKKNSFKSNLLDTVELIRNLSVLT